MEQTISSWNEIHKYSKHRWLYRGQAKASRDLQTSLERCCDRLDIRGDRVERTEGHLLRDFSRSYHQYAAHVPRKESVLEWLSLMQHHGAPTRMLDFSYSLYVAAYFALETAQEDSAVFAINGSWISDESIRLLRAGGKTPADADVLAKPTFEGTEPAVQRMFFAPPYVKTACPLNPFRLNERLRTQKGLFLVPGDISVPFMANIEALKGHDEASNLVKIIIPGHLRAEALRQLFHMNIGRTSLFPGLDGYAESLRVYHPVFDEP